MKQSESADPDQRVTGALEPSTNRATLCLPETIEEVAKSEQELEVIGKDLPDGLKEPKHMSADFEMKAKLRKMSGQELIDKLENESRYEWSWSERQELLAEIRRRLR